MTNPEETITNEETVKNVEYKIFVIGKEEDGILLSGDKHSWIGEEAEKIRSIVYDAEARLGINFLQDTIAELIELLLKAKGVKYERLNYVSESEEVLCRDKNGIV